MYLDFHINYLLDTRKHIPQTRKVPRSKVNISNIFFLLGRLVQEHEESLSSILENRQEHRVLTTCWWLHQKSQRMQNYHRLY